MKTLKYVLILTIVATFIFGMLPQGVFASCTAGTTNALCCVDGTKTGDCSVFANYSGYYCNAPDFVFRASKCGCPQGYVVDPADTTQTNCVLSKCKDGTALNTCASAKPVYCSATGVLENNSASCGCPDGYTTNGTSCRRANCVDTPSLCTANQTCDATTSACKLKAGCQYSNPACGSDKECNDVTGYCEDKPTGCQYGTYNCTAGTSCVNNECKTNAAPDNNFPSDNGSGTGGAASSAAPSSGMCCLPAAGMILVFGFVLSRPKGKKKE